MQLFVFINQNCSCMDVYSAGLGTHLFAFCFAMPLEQTGNRGKSDQNMDQASESCVNIDSVAFRHCWQPQQQFNKTLKMTNPSTGSPLIITHSYKKTLNNNWRCFLSIRDTPAVNIINCLWQKLVVCQQHKFLTVLHSVRYCLSRGRSTSAAFFICPFQQGLHNIVPNTPRAWEE